MRASFSGYFICGDPTVSNMRDDPPVLLLSKSGSRMQQIVPGADYDKQLFYDRGNQQVEISFRAQKVFNSPAECEQYILEYEAAAHHPWKGTLILYLDDPSSPKMCVMNDALISVPSFDYQGVRLFATYTVQGGGFEAATSVTALYFMQAGASLIPIPFSDPDAGQAWEDSGSSLIPAASFTTDPHWTTSGSSLIPTGA